MHQKNYKSRSSAFLSWCAAFLLVAISSFNANAQVTVAGSTGANSTYATLKLAFDAINANSAQAGNNITISITANTTETAIASLNQPATSSWASLTITPVGARTITGSLASELIVLNGADLVTIDGINSGGNSLTISNTSIAATSGTSTIKLQSDAQSNTITRCSILGSSTTPVGTNGGTIFFSTSGAGALGNDNNTISLCDIGPAGANLPSKAIYMNGSTTTTAQYNSGNNFTNNNIFDFFSASIQTAGVYLGGGAITNTFTSNRFYQTASRTHTTGVVHACIQMASATVQATTITGNVFGFANSGSTGTYTFVGIASSRFYAVYISTGATLATGFTTVSNNTIAGISISGSMSGTSTTAPLLPIYLLGEANATGNTIGSTTVANSISFTTSSASTSDVIPIYNFGSSATDISNNNIGNITMTNTGAASIAFRGIYTNTSSAVVATISNNNIGGNASTAWPILVNAPATSSRIIGIHNIALPVMNNNVIRNMSCNSTNTGSGTTVAVVGILNTYASTTVGNSTISNNTIFNLSNTTNTATAVHVYGLYNTASTTVNANVNEVFNNYIHTLTNASTSATATIRGMHVGGGRMSYYNNRVRVGTTTSEGIEVIGVYDALTTSSNNYYFNTVYVGGSGVTGASAGTFAFRSDGTTNTRNIRNNIFYNARSNGAGSGAHYGIRLGGTGTNPTGLTTNNNCLRADGTGGVLGFYDALDRGSLTAWKTATGQDANSTSSDPLLNTTTLKINSGLTPTSLESGGVPIAGISLDFEGDARPGPAGSVNGGPISGNPDIGADEFDGVPAVPMVYSSSTTVQVSGNVSHNTTNQAVIRIQVVTSGSSSPISATSFTVNANGTTSLSDIGANAKIYFTGLSSTYNTSILFGQAPVSFSNFAIGGTQVLSEGTNYFWLAYDVVNGATNGNVIDGECVDMVVNGNTETPSITAPAGSRMILGAMCGNYNVGAGQVFPNYTTIKDAFADINSRGISCAVVFTLTNNSGTPYNTANAEVFPLTLNSIAGASGANTITILPGVGLSPSIVGSSASGLIVLNGTSYLTIDGSNNGTSSRNLTINNTNAGTSSAVIWGQTTTVGAIPAANNTIKNCNIVGNTNATTLFGVGFGSSTISTTSNGTSNNSNTIQNNNFTLSQYGVYSGGLSTAAKNTGTSILQNIMNGSGANAIGVGGILVRNEDGITISENTILNITGSGTRYGISLGATTFNTYSPGVADAVTNALVNRNMINVTNAAGSSVFGIVLAPSTTGTNIIRNNAIYGLTGNATPSDFTCGIFVGGGAGSSTQVYHNSVNMSGAGTRTTHSYALAIGGSDPIVDVRNNVLVNSSTTSGAGRSYAFGTAYSSSFSNMIFDHNCLYTTGAQALFAGVGSLSAPTNQANLAALNATISGGANSIEVDPLFNSPTNLQPGLGSPILGTGTGVGVGFDILGIVRSGGSPSMGAYEVGADVIAPAISYTTLANTASTANYNFNGVTITDASGVNSTAGTKPRVYYKRSTTPNAFVGNTSGDAGWKFSEATNFTSPFNFVLDYSIMFGGAPSVGEVIQYFVVAQDLASPVNVGINSGIFNPATPATVNLQGGGVTSISGSINSYAILPSINGIVTVGSGGTYPSITGAGGLFASMNGSVITGDVTANIISNTTEDGANALNEFASPYTLTIQSSAAVVREIVGNYAVAGLIRFNGADRVSIDGRIAGSGKFLRFRNESTAQPVFTFLNDATNNTIRNSFIEGSNTTTATTTGGLILFGTTTGTTGNDDNSILNNDIRDRSDVAPVTSTPSYGIFSSGTTTSTNHFNSGIQIIGNNIFNIYNLGVNMGAGSNTCTINNNHFYLESSISIAGALFTTNINIASGEGHTVTGNFMGGQSANAGGSAWSVAGTASGNVTHYGIRFATGALTTVASTVSNNTIRNFNLSHIPSTSSLHFSGILVESGLVNVSGNTIGSNTGTGSIVHASTGTPAFTTGIELISMRTVLGGYSVTGNMLGSVTLSGTATSTMSIMGILTSGITSATPVTVSGNTIGSTVTANSILVDPSPNTTAGTFIGISNSSASPAIVNITGNTVANGNNNSTSTTAIVRGVSQSGTSSHDISNNIIHNLSGAGSFVGIANAAFNVSGIHKTSGNSSGTALINDNRIYNLSLTNTGAIGNNVAGIALTGVINTATPLEIRRNHIYGLTNASTGVTSTTPPLATGIFFRQPTTGSNMIVANNEISLGEGVANNTTFIGMWYGPSSATAYSTLNAFYNSVNIGGTVGAGSLPSYGFMRGDFGLVGATSPVVLRNNNFNNTRSGASTKNYAIANYATTPSATGWSATASNYNNLYSSNTATIGQWGTTDRTLALWLVSSAGDANSVSGKTIFTDALNGNLLPVSSTNCALNNTGTPITAGPFIIAVSTDITSAARNAGTPDIGAYEFNAVPTFTASSGSNSPVCVSSALNLTSSSTATNTPLTYSWSGPSFSSALQNPTIASNALSGTYNVTVTDAAGCTAVSNTNVVIDQAPTTSNAGSPQSVCATTATLAGNTATVGTGAWLVTAGSGSVTTPGSPTSGVTGLSLGANTFQWTISNGTCTPSSSTVTITRDAAPTTSNAGPAQSVCATSTTLAGNVPSVGTGTWTVTAGTGTFSPDANTANATVSGLSVGANTFTWTITNGACPPSASNVTITSDEAPTTSNAGSTQALCGSTSTTLAGNSPLVGVGTWTVTAGTGSFSPNANTANASVSGLSTGSNEFTWTITNGTCPPSASSVTIASNPNPTASAGSNSPVCIGQDINLTSTGGGTYSWTGPNGFTSNDQNPMIAGATATEAGLYEVTVTVNGCTDMASVNVIVNNCQVPCVTPVVLNTVNITGSEARLTWNNNVTGDAFLIKYWVTGSSLPAGYFYTSVSGPNPANFVDVANLTPATNYSWQVKTVCSMGAYSQYSAVATFNTLNQPQACGRPVNQPVTNIAATSAQLNWVPMTANNFQIKVTEVNTGLSKWYGIAGANMSYGMMTGLTPGTDYQAMVLAECGAPTGSSRYGSAMYFTTLAAAPGSLPCSTPYDVRAININPTSATIEWNAATTADQFRVRYAVDNGLYNWVYKTFSGTPSVTMANLTGLTNATNYIAQVQSICTSPSSKSVFSAYATFTTGATPKLMTEGSSSVKNIHVYPNPTDAYATMQFNAEISGVYMLQISDIVGRVIVENTGNANAGMNILNLDLSTYNKGIYLVTLKLADQTVTTKVVVQ